MSYAHDDWYELDYLDDAAVLAGTTAYMYGARHFVDGPCARDYDPWEHAEMLDLPIVFRDDLPEDDMIACYSHEHQAIFVRPGLLASVERCAIAHEIVHFEHGDEGTDDLQEERADQIAARRLIRPRRVETLQEGDPGMIALELQVTEKIMRVYMRMLRQGRIRPHG